jgi:hypothetical protein
MTHFATQGALPTVGDTIWVTRTVELPPGRTLRAADWQVADPVELLGPPRITLRGGSADVSYPLAVWRAGPQTLQVPGPLLLTSDGSVDSLGSEVVTLRVASVLPRAATDTSLRPQPRADFVPRPATTPIPLILLLVFALALLAPLHWWWRRRGQPAKRLGAAEMGGPARPPLERWAEAGESRAVAAAATSRLRSALAARLPAALPSLDTEAVLARVAEQRPDWPLDELSMVLRALDLARFGNGAGADALALARSAAELEPRLVPEAA